jgi:PilZ domain
MSAHGRLDTVRSKQEQKIRTARRVELRCILRFCSGEIEGNATITNISASGCRAESDINMAEGLDVQVILQLPNQLPPMKVERASVRWVSGNAFGLSFILFFPSERARLCKFLEHIK